VVYGFKNVWAVSPASAMRHCYFLKALL